MNRIIVAVFFLAAAVIAGPLYKVKRQATTYNLPDSAELIVGQIQTTFSCDGRKYGYYADVPNRCQIFHVCLPVEAETGNPTEPLIFSFFCGNQTIFDQANRVCAHKDDALPCELAESQYSVNDDFFKTDRP